MEAGRDRKEGKKGRVGGERDRGKGNEGRGKKRKRGGRDCERMEGGLGVQERGDEGELLWTASDGASPSNVCYLSRLLL